jgi:hypothetical protein
VRQFDARACFGTTIRTPALTTAGLRFTVRFHDLRHAHADADADVMTTMTDAPPRG